MLQTYSGLARHLRPHPTPAAFEAMSPARSLSNLLGPESVRVSMRRGDEIYAEGDAAEYCYTVVSGSVRLVKLMANGRRQICEFLLPGDFLGFESQDACYFSAEAVTDCVLVRYSRAAVDRLLSRNDTFAQKMRQLAAKGLEGAYKRMVLLCHKSAHERIAWFLLDMHARASANDNNSVILPMTRADIADYLGMVIETVSRTLKQLKESGAISVHGIHKITLLDREALECARGDI